MAKQNDTRFSQNKTQDPSKNEILQPSEWLKLLEPSLTNLGIISGLLGGLIFLVYFCNIKYFPELDAESLISLLGATTLLGLLLFLALAIFLLTPGMIWTSILDLDIAIYPLLSKNRIIVLQNINLEKVKISVKKNYILDKSYKFQKNNYNFDPRKIFIIYLYTFLTGFLFFTLYTSFNIKNTVVKEIILTKIISFNLTTKEIAYISSSLYVLMFIIMALAIHKNYFKISSGFGKKISLLQSSWISIKLFAYSIFSFSFYLISWLITSAFLSQSTNGASHFLPQYELLPIILATFASCLVTSLFVVCRYPKKQITFLLDLGIGSIILLLLIISLDKATVIPEKIMNTYGWGNMDNASIVLDNTGCQAIKSMNIKIDGSCLEKDKTYKIEGLCILSSVGKNYYLRFPRCNLRNGDPKPMEISLARANIIAWSRQHLKQRASDKTN
jgi:hypothetical protein